MLGIKIVNTVYIGYSFNHNKNFNVSMIFVLVVMTAIFNYHYLSPFTIVTSRAYKTEDTMSYEQ